MEANPAEAIKAKENAVKRFSAKDYAGARKYALKAQSLFPELDGISQMVATFEVYVASEAKVNGEIDFYSILGLKPSANRSMVKKQYKKLAVLLHPDKNKTIGADGAFKLVSEAWTLLSDNIKRASYDLKRSAQLSSHMVTFSDNCSGSLVPPTFWTVCTSCQVQYEYLRKYVNKRLSCKNCRSTFLAVELGVAPNGGSYPVCSWSHVPNNGYASHGCDGVTCCGADGVLVAGNGVHGYHSGHGHEYVSNVSSQWSNYPGSSIGYVDHNGVVTASGDSGYRTDGYSYKPEKKAKMAAAVSKTVAIDANVNGYTGSVGTKATTRPYKRRNVDHGGVSASVVEVGSKMVSQAGVANGNGSSVVSPKFCTPVAPAFDPRNSLIEKARIEIRKNLEEIKIAEKSMKLQDGSRSIERRNGNLGSYLQPRKRGPVTLTVPDSDFHDFDKDRSEECFKPKQIWALYDEEDGMPRLYCLIRDVISVNPFKIHVSYLGSKTDHEFGPINWISAGFTKSCGSFRAPLNHDVVEQVNMFSHLLRREKAGRGGCVRIYPKCSDVWAIYRNWSPNWNRNTPDEVRHQYDMVEVLDDYSEEFGVCIIPLVKLDGFKTVYRRNSDKNSMRWITRREMVRFSHQVPSWFLKEVEGLPKECWDLDPAATPDELLHAAEEEAKVEAGDGEACQADTQVVV
ncbi:hypothetical protein Droror1_Dr00002959 [Drosera rotundifolia]